MQNRFLYQLLLHKEGLASRFLRRFYSAGSGRELFADLEKRVPQLIVLDIMLPDEDGVSILRRLRADKRYAAIPVIMATAKGSEFDKVKGLDSGADDYIAKPFGMLEMVARIKAVLRCCACTIKRLKVRALACPSLSTA
nr:response regulator [uncultured Phascolarctobacterium sp.]